jgi:hypothetical protein
VSALIVAGGCTRCGLPQYGHFTRQSGSGGLHLFAAPTDETTPDSTKASAEPPAKANATTTL